MVRTNQSKKGFTLVELTVSLGLLSLVIVLTVGVLISVVRSYQRQRVIAEIERNGDFVMRSLEESLVGAFNIACIDSSGDPVIGVATCSATDSSHILRITYGTQSQFIAAKSFNAAGENILGCQDAGDNSNCYIVSAAELTDITTTLGGTAEDSIRLTNNIAGSGTNVSSFEFSITSGTPSVIVTSMELTGSKGTTWIEEVRQFQSFLTVRGTYH